MMNQCPKCYEGMLQQAIVNGQHVIVCHKCKTIFGNEDPTLIQMIKCDICESFYYKQNQDIVCCTINEQPTDLINESIDTGVKNE